MKKPIVLHPFLFGFYAALALFSFNIDQINLAVLRVVIGTALGSILLITIMRLIIRDSLRAGMLSSAMIMLGFSYGHVSDLLQRYSLGNLSLGSGYILFPLWMMILIIWAYFVLKKMKRFQEVNSYLNMVSIILLMFPLYSLFIYNAQLRAIDPWKARYISHVWQSNGVQTIEAHKKPTLDGELRDIYYIILDAYTRADVLSLYYGYDNRPFIEALQARGFIVAEGSQANYTDTEFSLASSLNMSHIHDAPTYFRTNSKVNADWVVSDVATMMIRDNRVGSFLREQGYTFVAYDSGYVLAQASGADEFLHAPQIDENSGMQIMFEMLFLDTTMGRLFLELRGEEFAPLQNLFETHRQRILFTLESLPQFAAMEGDFFVYAHVLSPHTPYVFGPNGEKLVGHDPFSLLDAHPGSEENIPLYTGQVQYLNKLVLNAIDQILENSSVPPIIIIQGDHSSKVFRGEEPDIQTRMQLLFPILNAYYLPDSASTQIYPTVTPVNTFRLIFNYYFGTQLDALPDRVYYFQERENHFDFVDVCQEYAYCLP